MSTRDEQVQRSAFESQSHLESPFLDAELFAQEPEGEWEARLAALEGVSPFVQTLEHRLVNFAEPEDSEDDLVEEDKWLDDNDSSVLSRRYEPEEPTSESNIEEDLLEFLEEWDLDLVQLLDDTSSDGSFLEANSVDAGPAPNDEDDEFEFEDEVSADHLVEEEASEQKPLPVPVGNPVPFAPRPPMGSYWPIKTSSKYGRLVSYMYQAPSGIVGRAGRMFLAGRKGRRDGKQALRWHVGVDLFAEINDVVVACEDGTIVNFSFFYKAKSGQPTYKLLIQHETSGVVVNYGEVTADSLNKNGLQVGMRVTAGQPIGFVSDTSMLHFETYITGTTNSHRWWKDENSPPRQLLNPTGYLLFLREHGLSPQVPGIQAVPGQSAPPHPSSISTEPPTELVRFAQRVLNAAEREQLKVDGDLGRLTKGALERFRKRHGLGADGVLDDRTQLALAQRALEEIRQQSLFTQFGLLDEATRQAVIAFKSDRGLGLNATIDTATRAALADAVTQGVGTLGTSPAVAVTDWTKVAPDERMRHAMGLLVRKYQYPVNGAAGIVGNLWAESGVLPNRVEGSSLRTPMTAADFKGRRIEFTAEQVMNRHRRTEEGPMKAGVGLAQWTTADRRLGLFHHIFQEQRLGAAILYNMDAQVDYLVAELGKKYKGVDQVLRNPGVSLEDASDEVVYSYERPGSILTNDKPIRRLPRIAPAVQNVFDKRRRYSRAALQAYRPTHPEP